jgi:2-polyprenyl-6-methoxyphenol hydroxylase-like FAD-dependent oxidoreductase
MTLEETDVLIVGAGPVGLALAIELGLRSVRCTVVEQHDRVGLNPRAKTTNVRSREHLRRWGVAQALREMSPLPPGYPSDIVFATGLSGHVVARIENAFDTSTERNELYSEPGQWVPQYSLEEVLRKRAAGLPGVRIVFNRCFETAVQDAQGVSAEITDLEHGSRYAVRSKFLVGADGPRSAVRKVLGIEMSGPGALAPNYNCTFRAPGLERLNKLPPAVQYWMLNPEVPGLVGPLEPKKSLWFFVGSRLGAGVDFSDIDPEDLIRRATGLDFGMNIEARDPWTAHRLIADSYGEGRMFIAGDACHLHPPFGGYGMNMGIGDAVDLGWKLAATLQGWGGAGLLRSYERERKPVHERVMSEAVENYAMVGDQLVRPDLDLPGEQGERARRETGEFIVRTKTREFKTLGVVLGYRYANSSLIVPDGTPPPPETVTEYRPSAHPGCLAPHLWLDDGSSLYDHLGPGYTLLASPSRASEAADSRLHELAGARGIPLTSFIVGDRRFEGLYKAQLALVRPDQHIAWRGYALPADAGALLDRISGTNVGEEMRKMRKRKRRRNAGRAHT